MSGATATAALTVKGSSLATGNNTITATYGGSASFSGSTGIGDDQCERGNRLECRRIGGAEFDLSDHQRLGSHGSTAGDGGRAHYGSRALRSTERTSHPRYRSFFGSSKIAALGTLSSSMQIQWKPLPATIVFAFTGVDASGRQWSQSLSVIRPLVTAIREERNLELRALSAAINCRLTADDARAGRGRPAETAPATLLDGISRRDHEQ